MRTATSPDSARQRKHHPRNHQSAGYSLHQPHNIHNIASGAGDNDLGLALRAYHFRMSAGAFAGTRVLKVGKPIEKAELVRC